MRRPLSFKKTLLLPALALSACLLMLATPAHALSLPDNQNACGDPLYVADQLIVDFAWPAGGGKPDLDEVDARVQQILARLPREEGDESEEVEALKFRQLPPRSSKSPSLSVLLSRAGSAGPLELSARLRQLPAVEHARPNFLYPLGHACEDATGAVEGFDAPGSLVAAPELATTDRLLLRYSYDGDEDVMTQEELEQAVRLSFLEIGLAGSLSIEVVPGVGLRAQSSEIPDARAVAGMLAALEEIEWAQPDPVNPCSLAETGEAPASNPCGLVRDQQGERTLVLFSSNFIGGTPPEHSSGGALGPDWAWGLLLLWGWRQRRQNSRARRVQV